MKKKIILIALFFLIVDIISKIVIDHSLELLESSIVIPNFFSITKIYNYGASWNILRGHRYLLIILTFITLGIIFYYQRKFKINKRNILAFGLLYGGILGNLLDRIIYGYVIDFFDFNLFGYNYPVFNFADICIVCGIFLLIFAIFKKEDENGIKSWNWGYKNWQISKR